MSNVPIIILAAMLMLLTLSTASPAREEETARGFLAKSVKVDGRDVKYIVYVPPQYDPKKPNPTIVFLNGAGECGTDGLKQIAVGLGSAVMFNVEKWPFLIVLPQKQVVEHNWEDEDAMVMAILKKTKQEYKVDESRLYLTGLSQGGHGTWAIGALHPDTFAAIAPICGWGDEQMAKKLVKMPIWVFHGADDPVVKVDAASEMEKHLKAAGGSCRLTVYPGVGHNSWDKAYREENLYEWFLQHHK